MELTLCKQVMTVLCRECLDAEGQTAMGAMGRGQRTVGSLDSTPRPRGRGAVRLSATQYGSFTVSLEIGHTWMKFELYISFVTLGEQLSFSVPHFPSINGDAEDKTTCLIGLL